MKKWFSYGFLALVGLAAALFAYHFYAAADAGQKLDESIQQVSQEANLNLTINYSSIEVSPFSGDVVFSDVNIIRDQDIQRAKTARFDLAYSEFVNITLWGTEYGLREIEQGILQLSDLSYTNRSSLIEVKLDSLHIDYRGNLWNLIVLGITRASAVTGHHIDAIGTRFSFSQPSSDIGAIRADTLTWRTHFGRPAEPPDSLYSTAALSGITWTPPKAFQDKYSFFIQGFGYRPDTIPMERATARYRLHPSGDSLSIDRLTLYTDLFNTTAKGMIAVDGQSPGQSRLNNLVIRLEELSPRFRNFLGQLKKLTGLPLPHTDDSIVLSLDGSVDRPRITITE
ncbi:MAG: hypothetical protein R3224_01260 [Balneolaceae bacterium]|nr:hypothetical protein [Balneolaceae bacterium]